jgi:hypothetical protein
MIVRDELVLYLFDLLGKYVWMMGEILLIIFLFLLFLNSSYNPYKLGVG